jgi:hypothetical protein
MRRKPLWAARTEAHRWLNCTAAVFSNRLRKGLSPSCASQYSAGTTCACRAAAHIHNAQQVEGCTRGLGFVVEAVPRAATCCGCTHFSRPARPRFQPAQPSAARCCRRDPRPCLQRPGRAVHLPFAPQAVHPTCIPAHRPAHPSPPQPSPAQPSLAPYSMHSIARRAQHAQHGRRTRHEGARGGGDADERRQRQQPRARARRGAGRGGGGVAQRWRGVE